MTRKRLTLSGVAALAVFALVASACGGGGGTNTNGNTNTGNTGNSGGAKPARGGVYRTAIEDFGFTGAFDPTGEYLGNAWGLYSQLLLRNLVTYKHIAGTAGDSLVPDLATNTGDVSSDGLTYTFHLKPGVKFGPPVNRAITSKDIEYAFERINTKPLVAQYGFYYYGVIKGMDGTATSPKPISGIETPDDNTIIFHLEQPTGDLLFRLAMPATAPVPPEVGKCFTKAGDYGRDIIPSGPYMIQGSDQVDVSSCGAIKPMAGFDPTKQLKFVRNPAYDPKTDSPTVRENFLDGVSITIDTNTDDIFNKIQSGDLDGTWASTPPKQIEQQYLTNPDLKPLIHSDAGDRTWYITMNYLAAPFDDIHVRKAVNFVIDKAALQKAWGGPIHGQIATHIMPPTVLPGFPADYDPYKTPNSGGDVNAAKNEMKQSKYDHNHDGMCDDPVCKNVLFVNRTITPFTDMTPTIQEDLSSIGIQVKVRELDTGTAYTTIQTLKNLVPIAANAGWGKDYADPSTFAVLFDSSGVNCTGQINYAEVGITAAQAKECGVTAAYNKFKSTVPNVDAQVKDCGTKSGDERRNCWIDFDKNLMENVVPWVPYLWGQVLTVVGKSVTKYEFDQFSGAPSFCHMAVNNKATVT